MTGSYEAGSDGDMLKLASQIVSAYVGAHTLSAQALPGLIRDIYQSLANLQAPPVPTATPAVPLRRSVFHDHLVCLEDGLSMKMLKRHLLTVHQMSPEEYRAKWGLTADYPMVAPDYAKVRSALAKQSGLGKKPEDRTRSGSVTGRALGDAGAERKRRGD